MWNGWVYGKRVGGQRIGLAGAAALIWAATAACEAAPLAAQSPDVRADSARSAFAAGRLEEASHQLAALAADLPDDAGIHWLYAQVLRAAGNPAEARIQFRRATQLAPDDPWLRLEFGRFLVEAADRTASVELLEPLLERVDMPAVSAEAETLTGLAEYWDGDSGAAAVHLRRALELDPAREEARAALRDVQRDRSSAMQLRTSFADDDQPLQVLGQALAVSSALGGRVQGHVEASAQRRAGNDVGETVLGAAAGFAVALPGGRVRVRVEGGALRRGDGMGTMALGSGEARVRVAPDTYVRGQVRQEPYLWTLSSIDTALAVTSFEAGVDRRGAPGWAGEAGVRIERYPDDNVVRTLSAWVLAPAYVTPESGVRLGYAAAFQDSRQTTFRAATTVPVMPGAGIPGVYAPYFTPEELQSHSLIVEGRSGHSDQTSLRVTAVYAPWATEQAPFIVADAVGVALPAAFSERTFKPWSLRALVTAVVSPTTTLSLAAEHGRTAFYEVSRLEASLTYRLVPSALTDR